MDGLAKRGQKQWFRRVTRRLAGHLEDAVPLYEPQSRPILSVDRSTAGDASRSLGDKLRKLRKILEFFQDQSGGRPR